MKHFVFCMVSFFTCVTLHAQDRSITFDHSSWADIKAKAAKEKKAIFMDCYTSWCGPCKRLAKEVFTRNEVADYYNANFINVSFDMEKGEGPQLAKEYGIHAYPTLMFVDAEGKLISKQIGAVDSKAFLGFGKMSVGGQSLESLTAQYKKGDRSVGFMKTFMTRMEGIHENTASIIEEYFSKTSRDKWQSKENWYFITRYVRTEQSPVFQYVHKNQKSYEQKFSADSVSDYFVEVYRNSIQKAANTIFPVEDLQELKDSINQMNFAGKYKLALECDMASAGRSGDWKAYADATEGLFTKYPEKDTATQLEWLNRVCWTMLQKSSDPYVLQKATKLASTSMQYKKPVLMDTYASLLVETGNFDKAIEIEQQIMAMLKVKADPDFSISDCDAQLDKFNRRKLAVANSNKP
jgi:thioredoxin-related protein